MRRPKIPLERTSGARAVFFVDGFGSLDRAGVEAGTLAVMHDGDAPVLRLEPRTIALVFGGVSLGRRYMQGNFIASTEARLDAAPPPALVTGGGRRCRDRVSHPSAATTWPAGEPTAAECPGAAVR